MEHSKFFALRSVYGNLLDTYDSIPPHLFPLCTSFLGRDLGSGEAVAVQSPVAQGALSTVVIISMG